MKPVYKPKECAVCGAVYVPRSSSALYCDGCRAEAKAERKRKWCAAHREEELERNRKYHVAHPEKTRERSRKYYAAHREEKLERDRKWRAAHPEEMREYHRKYRAEHRETRDFFALMAAADAIKQAM